MRTNRHLFRQTALYLIFIFSLCTSFYGCGGSENEPDYPTNKNINANVEDSNHPGAGSIEIPKLINANPYTYITHSAAKNQTATDKVSNYTMEYHTTKCHSRWVAFKFYNTTGAANVGRTDPEPWDNDPQLPVFCQTQKEDYSPYQRGHLCASADRVYSREANVQTFYYSNMSPQIGHFNTNTWEYLEEFVRNLGRSNSFRDTLYVCKGGTIENNQILGKTSKGSHQVVIPQYYFMALLCKKGNEYKSIGFFLEHKGSWPDKPYDRKQFAMSIDKLEEKTGIDFFCNLPDDIENTVERSYNTSDWTGL